MVWECLLLLLIFLYCQLHLLFPPLPEKITAHTGFPFVSEASLHLSAAECACHSPADSAGILSPVQSVKGTVTRGRAYPRVRPLFCLRVPCRISYIPSSSVFYVSFYSISNVRRDRIAFPALSSVTQFSHGFLRDRQTENPHQGHRNIPHICTKQSFALPERSFPIFSLYP